MTSASSDGPNISKHHTTKEQRRILSERMKNPEDELKLVIVRDMWLTGFDVPCLHTLYIDKPMQGHNLMQAIARVNRVFKDKPGVTISGLPRISRKRCHSTLIAVAKATRLSYRKKLFSLCLRSLK
jgi:type I site-specific restriction-modification system R (restriction) subunit